MISGEKGNLNFLLDIELDFWYQFCLYRIFLFDFPEIT